MQYEIKNRFTGAVQFTAEIDCAEDALRPIKLGLAVRLGIKEGANLAGANLAGAYLANADLGWVNLTDANLRDADLADAYLAGANLAGAYLAGADLAGAYLMGANLADARGVVDLGTPYGWRAVGWWKDGKPWVRVGCRDKSLADGKVYWADKPHRREVMAALAYFEAVAAIRAEKESA